MKQNKLLLLLFIKPLLICGAIMPLLMWGVENKSQPADKIQSIQIQARHLKLNFEEKNSAVYTFQWKGDLSFENQEGVLKIQSKDFSSKKIWSNKGKKAELTILGPSKPLKVFASVSDISASGWKQPVFISSFNGKIKTVNTKNTWEIATKQGKIYMTKHKGSLKSKSFEMTLNLVESEGNFEIQATEAQLQIKQCQGSLNIVTNKSKTKLTRFKGNMSATIHSGEIRGSLKPNKVDLKTEDASVRLYLMGQGANVKAYSEKGQIYVPKYFNKKFEGKSTRVSGRMRAKIKKGEVLVETNRGNIYIN